MLLLIQLNCDCNGFSTWLWPLILAFLLGFILGWLLSKLLGGSTDNDDNKYRQKYLDTKTELDLCRRDAKTNLAGASALGVNSLTNDKTESKEKVAATIVTDDSVKDDLTKVEGIGPKIQGLLNNDGIWSWKQLSETSVDSIQKVLDDAGPRYRVHNPKSWPLQAAMCHKGEWKKLEKWQDEHKGGRM